MGVALAIVLEQSWDITLVGLDVTDTTIFRPADLAQVDAAATPAARIVSAITAVAVFAPGDLRRPAFGRAVIVALLAAQAFEVFAVATKEVPPIYRHVPRADDPYDTFVSLAIFFVPLALLAAAAGLPLCRRAEPLPAARVKRHRPGGVARRRPLVRHGRRGLGRGPAGRPRGRA
jgi:hypothetical protein